VFKRLDFITGIDSPVRIDSLTITLPDKRIKSHGKSKFSGTLITSPGRSSSLPTVKYYPAFLSSTGHVNLAIYRIFSVFEIVW
jgi:hypothetical protein